METVEDQAGDRYLRLKRSATSSLVYDPITDTHTHRPNVELTVIDGTSPLTTAARTVPAPVRRLIRSVHSDETVGLLVALDAADGMNAADVLARTTFCESDLYATLRNLEAGDLIERDDQERWQLTEIGRAGLSAVRQS